MPRQNTIEAAKAYLATSESLLYMPDAIAYAAPVGFGGMACLDSLFRVVKERYQAVRLNRLFASEPVEITPPCLRNELISATDRAHVVLGLPVGSDIVPDEFYN